MAIIRSAVIGSSKGSVGNVTLQSYKGKTVGKQKVALKKRAVSSDAQLAQQGRFKGVVQYASGTRIYVANAYDETKFGFNWNKYMKVNYPVLSTIIDPEYSLAQNLVALAAAVIDRGAQIYSGAGSLGTLAYTSTVAVTASSMVGIVTIPIQPFMQVGDIITYSPTLLTSVGEQEIINTRGFVIEAVVAPEDISTGQVVLNIVAGQVPMFIPIAASPDYSAVFTQVGYKRDRKTHATSFLTINETGNRPDVPVNFLAPVVGADGKSLTWNTAELTAALGYVPNSTTTLAKKEPNSPATPFPHSTVSGVWSSVDGITKLQYSYDTAINPPAFVTGNCVLVRSNIVEMACGEITFKEPIIN